MQQLQNTKSECSRHLGACGRLTVSPGRQPQQTIEAMLQGNRNGHIYAHGIHQQHCARSSEASLAPQKQAVGRQFNKNSSAAVNCFTLPTLLCPTASTNSGHCGNGSLAPLPGAFSCGRMRCSSMVDSIIGNGTYTTVTQDGVELQLTNETLSIVCAAKEHSEQCRVFTKSVY